MMVSDRTSADEQTGAHRLRLLKVPTVFDNYNHLSALQQPQIILLREGTDTSQGKPQLISNINACMAVVDAVRSTLGPRGMDKLVIDDRVSSCTRIDSRDVCRTKRRWLHRNHGTCREHVATCSCCLCCTENLKCCTHTFSFHNRDR